MLTSVNFLVTRSPRSRAASTIEHRDDWTITGLEENTESMVWSAHATQEHFGGSEPTYALERMSAPWMSI